ncbi:MAG: tetratricopeptide repeat protein [Chitinophagales bacterium]
MKEKIFFAFTWCSVLLTFSLVGCKPEKPAENTEKNDLIQDQALSYLDSMIQANPRNADLYYDRSLYLSQHNNLPKAVSDIYSALQLDSAKVEYYYLGADLFVEMGEGSKAVALISKAINNFPKNEELYLRAVEYNYYMKSYESALNFCNDLLELNAYNADAYFLKGMIYKELKQENKAISSFQTCVEVDPSFYNAYMQLGLIYSKNKNDQAIQYFENASKLADNQREALYAIAYHFQSKKEFSKAIKEYKNMLSIDPKDHEVFYNIGYCYIDLDSLDKAYKHFDMALKLQPQYTGAYYMKGYVSELVGNKKEALENYQQALKLLPNDSTILAALQRVQP